jgi:AmmeMemoRadiSam system protein B
MVGTAGTAEVATMIAAAIALAGPGTVVVCSTDLSHDQAQAAALRQDLRTAEAVVQVRPGRIRPADACGAFALRGLLDWAARAGLRGVELDRSSSARTGGNPRQVVGYGAFALVGGDDGTQG